MLAVLNRTAISFSMFAYEVLSVNRARVRLDTDPGLAMANNSGSGPLSSSQSCVVLLGVVGVVLVPLEAWAAVTVDDGEDEDDGEECLASFDLSCKARSFPV